MRKLWMVLGLAVALAVSPACDDDEEENGGGSGGGGGTGGMGGTGGEGGTGGMGGTGGEGGQILVDVVGTAALNPLAQAWYASGAGGAEAPSVAGLPIMIIDPIKSIAQDPAAVLAQGTIAGDGTFSFTDVDFTEVTAGVVVTIDDAGTEFARGTTPICQAAQCVAADTLTALAFAVPTEFVDALETSTALELLSDTEGFILGWTAQPTGTPGVFAPLEGVSIGVTPESPTYLAPDFTVSAGDVTTAIGGFILESPAGQIRTMTPALADTAFTPANASVGTAPNVVFQVLFVGVPTTP